MHEGGDYFSHLSFYILYVAMITSCDGDTTVSFHLLYIKQATMNGFSAVFFSSLIYLLVG